MKDILTTEEWIRAIKALLFLNKDPENIDIEQIKKIIEETTAGAYELPAVSSEDNGKVLGVENGQFGLVDGGGDVGYECVETERVLFNETVTVAENNGVYVADLDYVMSEPVNELIITFDGTRYVCQGVDADGDIVFGGVDVNTQSVDFTNYPFAVMFSGDHPAALLTNTDGTHTVVASVSEIAVETTPCFEKAACESAVCILTANTKIEGTRTVLSLNKTWQEIYDIAKTKMVLLRTYESGRISFAPLVMMDSDHRVEFGSDVFVADSADGYPTRVSAS